MIAPILEELATELEGKLTIRKVNVDNDGPIAAQYGIRAIPPSCSSKAASWLSNTSA